MSSFFLINLSAFAVSPHALALSSQVDSDSSERFALSLFVCVYFPQTPAFKIYPRTSIPVGVGAGVGPLTGPPAVIGCTLPS